MLYRLDLRPSGLAALTSAALLLAPSVAYPDQVDELATVGRVYFGPQSASSSWSPDRALSYAQWATWILALLPKEASVEVEMGTFAYCVEGDECVQGAWDPKLAADLEEFRRMGLPAKAVRIRSLL